MMSQSWWPCWWSRTKAPLGTKLYFQVTSSRKNPIVWPPAWLPCHVVWLQTKNNHVFFQLSILSDHRHGENIRQVSILCIYGTFDLFIWWIAGRTSWFAPIVSHVFNILWGPFVSFLTILLLVSFNGKIVQSISFSFKCFSYPLSEIRNARFPV